MKGITVLLASIVLASFVGFGLAKVQERPLAPSEKNANAWTVEEHQIAADLFEETAVRLELKVRHLEQRVERFAKKPYLDPKGFKRQGWERLIGAHRSEISELREQMAWHRTQASQFNAMPSSEEPEKAEEGKTS